MEFTRAARRILSLTTVAGLAVASFLAVPAPVLAQDASQPVSGSPSVSIAELSQQVWSKARAEGDESALRPLDTIPQEGATAGAQRLRSGYESLSENLAKRESQRAEKMAEVEANLEAELAKTPQTPGTLGEALVAAVEMQLLSRDRAAVLHDARVTDLMDRAARAARKAEAEGDWLNAHELLYRLNTLTEEQGTYRDDYERLANRLGMIRLYRPDRFWEMRNEQRVNEGKDPLPEFNALGEDFREKLEGINESMVFSAVIRADRQHIDNVERRQLMRDMLKGGLEGVRTMATTTDLHSVFPGLSDEAERQEFISFLDAEIQRISGERGRVDQRDLLDVADGLLNANARTVRLPKEALLHEFGNAAMAELDDYTAIVWPDEVKRFNRMTQGEFVGVGIHIQLDEETHMIKVLTPLEGTPAQRAGLRRGDLIKAIDGDSAVGIGLNQAVEEITGPAGTDVVITVEREGENGEAQDLDFTLTRAVIDLPSVKGWRKTGPGDQDWDWFIDEDAKIGYLRLTGFQKSTTDELLSAIREMKRDGAQALIFDLRFNPGGLLTEAVSVANMFIDRGTIVSTEGTMPPQEERAQRDRAILGDMPVVVLINEGSASASEIVSGAIRHYADREGGIDALLVGQRSFGKGSVQNVWPLTNDSMMKLTTQYYKLPDGHILHRHEGATVWGVDPHVHVDMLPEQITEALKLRQDADLYPIDENGNVIETDEPRPDPQQLLTGGTDLQLQAALVLLQAKVAGVEERHVRALGGEAGVN